MQQKQQRDSGAATSCEMADRLSEIARKLADTTERLNCGNNAALREDLRHYAAEIYLLAERLDFLVDVEETARRRATTD